MKILSIGFKNPFHESGYTNTIEINNLENINVFIGKNNSGKTNVFRSIYNLLHQDIDRSKIFRYLKVKLDHKDINLILGKFCDKILKIYQNRNNATPETDRRKNRLKSNLENGKFVNAFNPLCNLKLKTDNPFYKTFSMILNFNCDVITQKILFNYEFENIDDLNVDLKPTIEKILKGISLDQDLTSLLIDHILPLKNVILIPSFRTLGSSEKDYQTQEITKIKETIKLLFEKSFSRIPIDLPREKPFEIPNLALILNTIKREKISYTYRSLIGPEFFETFNSSLRQIFPNIKLSIKWNFSDQKTIGGYIEDDKDMGNWTKLGHGTQELISLLFLLMLPRDGIYIIDEPENGLHPGLQLKLLRFIKDLILTDDIYSKQFFFATHSTSFIDFSGDCSHFVCKKDKELFSIEWLEKEKLNILRNELGLKPSSLLQANGIIWIEGVSGKPYVKMLFQCFEMNLDNLDVIIIHFGGSDDITSNHYTIDLLESINPNFCIIIDSEKNEIDDNIDDLLEKKTEFEQRGHFFWILEKFRNIEGIIPQEVINEYFDIKIRLSNENLKQPFENLTSYIKRLKDPSVGIMPKDRKKYNKTRDAPRICELIKSNPEYKMKIIENEYLKKNIKKIEKEIEKWNHIELDIHDSYEEDFYEIAKETGVDLNSIIKLPNTKIHTRIQTALKSAQNAYTYARTPILLFGPREYLTENQLLEETRGYTLTSNFAKSAIKREKKYYLVISSRSVIEEIKNYDKIELLNYFLKNLEDYLEKQNNYFKIACTSIKADIPSYQTYLVLDNTVISWIKSSEKEYCHMTENSELANTYRTFTEEYIKKDRTRKYTDELIGYLKDLRK